MTSDFVFNQVYRGAKNRGASERCAHNAALSASEKYRKNRYIKKPIDLIEDAIKEALKLSKIDKTKSPN